MSRLTFAALACALTATGAAATPQLNLPSSTTGQAAHVVQIKNIKTTPGGVVKGQIKQNGTVNLTSSDCTNVGGKVITVTDDRCGSSRQYCRMPDTNAVCIDKVN
jgi:putative hemolysin